MKPGEAERIDAPPLLNLLRRKVEYGRSKLQWVVFRNVEDEVMTDAAGSFYLMTDIINVPRRKTRKTQCGRPHIPRLCARLKQATLLFVCDECPSYLGMLPPRDVEDS